MQGSTLDRDPISYVPSAGPAYVCRKSVSAHEIFQCADTLLN